MNKIWEVIKMIFGLVTLALSCVFIKRLFDPEKPNDHIKKANKQADKLNKIYKKINKTTHKRQDLKNKYSKVIKNVSKKRI